MDWRYRGRGTRLVLVLAVITLAVVDSASGDSANGNGTQGPIPPSVFIAEPEDRTFVLSPSFEINGGLGGSVQDIDVAIDGIDLGPARRGEVAGDWRFPAEQVSVTPGRHLITVTADGEGGTATASAWIYYDTQGRPFVVEVHPERTTYQQGDTAIAADPDLLLFGPPDDPVTLDMSTSAPPQLRAMVNARLSTGSLASFDLDIRDDSPGEYPATVRGVGPDGTAMEAIHTVVIAGPPDTQTGGTDPPTAGSRVLFDDFESGRDRWTTTMSGTNGSNDSVQLLGSGGNPGGYRLMRHTLPATADGEGNPTQITVVHLYGAGSWDPGVDGALAHINYSEDRIELEPPFEGAAVGALFVLEQGGTRYFVSLDDNNAFTNTTWGTLSRERLTPGDFSPAPGPDFTTAGAPMTFGILRSNTNRSASEIVVTHGLDNWLVELVRPEG